MLACSGNKEPIKKFWLNHPVDISQIQPVTNTYHMIDSTGTKVGAMIFGFAFEDGFLMARDTSQFDDGSIYETASFTFDTTDFKMKEVSIELQTRRAALDIDLRSEDGKVKGTYVLKRDTTTTTHPIDSAYQFTNFRGEIYILTHALMMKPADTVEFRALEPTRMTLSNGQLLYSGTETIETLGGMELCDVLWLKADGNMPDNKIWVRQRSPRTIIKFYVPGPELNIVLVRQDIK